MVYAQAAIVFLLPLILTPRLLFYYDITPKVALLMLAAVLALAAAAVGANSWSLLAGSRSGRWFLLAALGSMASAGVSAWRSADPPLAWYGSNWRRLGSLTEWAVIVAALWMAWTAISSRRNFALLLRALCAAGLAASLYGVAQYGGWDPILMRSDYSAGEGIFQIVRPPGPLGHSDYFAAFLLWPVFAGLALARVDRQGVWRCLSWSSAIAGSAAILLSGSRGALLGLCCGAVVRMLLDQPRWRGVLWVASIAALTLGLFYISPAGERLRARVHWIADDPAGGARPLLWRDALKMATHKPLTGFGPDDFVAAFPQFESEDLARAYPDFSHESPHNLLLDVLNAQGAVGLLALAAVILIAVAGSLRVRTANPLPSSTFLPGLAAGLVAHQFAVWTAPNAFFFYFACCVLANAGVQENAATVPLIRVPHFLSSNLWRRAIAAAALSGSALFALAAYRLVAEDAALSAVDRRLNRGDAAGAVQAYRNALALQDAGVSADLYFSRRFSRVAMSSNLAMPKLYYSQVAMGAAGRATRQPEQFPNAWFNLSVLEAANNDAARTESALRSAIAAAPNWYKPHWILARLLASQGRAEATVEARLALDLNGGKDAEVTSTLAQVLRSAGSKP